MKIDDIYKPASFLVFADYNPTLPGIYVMKNGLGIFLAVIYRDKDGQLRCVSGEMDSLLTAFAGAEWCKLVQWADVREATNEAKASKKEAAMFESLWLEQADQIEDCRDDLLRLKKLVSKTLKKAATDLDKTLSRHEEQIQST